MPASFEGAMFRVPVLVLLACAIAGASPLSWNWDIFQPANSLRSIQTYVTTPDAINSIANSYFTSAGDVATWIPATAVLSDAYRKGDGGDETGVGVAGDLRVESETLPGSFTQLDLSSLFGRPQIIGRHRAFGAIPVREGS
jgi:hypothetical protein